MRWRWGKEIVFNPRGGRIKGLRTKSSCLYNGITIMRQLFSWKLRGGGGNFRGKDLHRNDVPIDCNDSLTLYSPSQTQRSTPSLPPGSYCKCNQDRKWERERGKGPDGRMGEVGDCQKTSLFPVWTESWEVESFPVLPRSDPAAVVSSRKQILWT